MKKEIKLLLEDESLTSEITPQAQDNFQKYLSKKLDYFYQTQYLDSNLQILFTAVNDFYYLITTKNFLTKLDLLQFQIEQLEHSNSYT